MRVFGLVYDDTQVILVTLWKEYHPIVFSIAAILLVLIVSQIAKYWMTLAKLNDPTKTGLMILPLFLLFVIMARGGMLTELPLGIKHAYVTQDLFINRVSLTPFLACGRPLKPVHG